MSEPVSFETYAKKIPLLHTWDGGVTWNEGGFGPDHLEAFHKKLLEFGAGTSVIETGAGNSTITFLLSGASRVESFCVDASVFDRVRKYCSENGVNTGPLHQHVGLSELLLPPVAADTISKDKWFDFALVDGGHGWPTAFVDFCYMNAVLRSGGYIVIDDYQLHSVKELARFLANDGRYQLVQNLGKTLIFRKLTTERFLPDFGGQPYVLTRTEEDRRADRTYALEWK